MPSWQPLPRIAYGIAIYPFSPSQPQDLPLELGSEIYVYEATTNGNWLRGYLVAPPSLLAGLTSEKGQTLEARVFNGIFPRNCVEIREILGEGDDSDDESEADAQDESARQAGVSDSNKTGLGASDRRKRRDKTRGPEVSVLGSAEGKLARRSRNRVDSSITTAGRLSLPLKHEPGEPRPPAPMPMLKIGDETPTSASEPLIDEIASCLREWHSTNLHGLLLSRDYGKLDKLWQLVTSLNLARQQFLHNVLTAWEYNQLREKTVWNLVQVNKLCGGEVIVRDPKERGRILTADDSVVDITKLQCAMSLLDESPTQAVELAALHHLMVDIKGFTGASNEVTTVVMYLACKSSQSSLTPLSESYIIQVPIGGQVNQGGKNIAVDMRTLFADLSSIDIGEVSSADSELFLVVKIRAPHQILVSHPSSKAGPLPQTTPVSKDSAQTSAPVVAKGVRRSLMWAKGSRAAFSRGSPKLNPLSEQGDEVRPSTTATGYEGTSPGTATSKAPPSPVECRADYMSADRTVGVGALRLNSILKQGEQVDQVISIWAPSTKFETPKFSADKEWDPIIRDVMDSKTGNYEKSRITERLQVHLQLFNHEDADALIKATPTIFSGICKTNKRGFTGAPTKPRSDIYVTLDVAHLSRQTLLSRFGGGASSLPNHFHGDNLQLTLEVRRSSGDRIEKCIHSSSNTDPVGTWKSVVTERGDAWHQTVKLQIEPQDVISSHIVLELADLPNRPFALAYMPLWENRAFISDGPHALRLYTQAPAGDKAGYLTLPYKAKDDGSADVTGPIASLRVETYLCSTIFSQDRVILGLVKWKEWSKDDIPDLLKQLIFVAEIEVVKLLSEVLDALFGILVEYSGNDEYEDLVFTALVRVLDIVHDRRFNLAPIVDLYAENKFSFPYSTQCLIRSFTRLLANPTEPEIARKLRATFKVVRHILKFITHGRGQQKEKEAGIGITNSGPGFTRQLRGIFKALDTMMRSMAPALVGSQTIAVQHFHTWLPELEGLLTTEEILHIAIDFMDSCALVKGKLVLYKLVLLINYSKLAIFSHPERRSALTANTARWIAPHWGHTDEVTDQWKDQVRLCCSVLAGQVEYLGPEIPDYIPKIIESYLAIQPLKSKPRNRFSLLFPTQYPFPCKTTSEEVVFEEALVELPAILSALSNSTSGMQLELANEDVGVMVEKTLSVYLSILQGDAFPLDWLSVQIFHHKSTMRTLEYIANILLESFLPHPDEAETFDTELWKLFFTTLLKLVGSSSLALETFPEQKRRAVWKIAGDVREQGADMLRRTWEAIGWEASQEERARYGLTKMGGYQVQYVPTLVGPIVDLCLSVHEGLRRIAVKVLQTVIVSEWTLCEDLSAIQTEMIDSLDLYFKTKPLTESMLQKLFVGELTDQFLPLSQIPDDPLYTALGDFVATITEFLDLLVAVHSGDGTDEGAQMIHRLRLMEFLRDMQKEEIFIHYVHQLADLQTECRNHAEAGLALRLHADLYGWDPNRQTRALVDPAFPAQSQFERKERIYFDMIRHFEDGEAWGTALDAYQELRGQYETNVFDFAKLARTDRAIATIYERVAKSERLVPKYFRVIFRGLGFPTTLRDKEFIFEGSPLERTAAFTDRMQEQYPSAQILTSGKVEDVEGQFLVISAVSAHRDLAHHVFQRSRVSPVVRDYLVSRHPYEFSVSSKRNTSGPVHEHYAEKKVYTTAEAFPTILRRSEIVAVHEMRLSAKETALERIVRKTAEMATVEKKVAEGEGGDETARLLLDAVSISVNPNSTNSVVCYRQLIPETTEKSLEDSTDSGEHQESKMVELDAQENAVKMALVDHALLLKKCLATFARSQNVMLTTNLHHLQTYFEQTFAPEMAAFTRPLVTRGPDSLASPTWAQAPLPVLPSSPPQSEQPVMVGTVMNGASVSEESSVVQPSVLKPGRTARLSIFGRQKDHAPKPDASAHVNSDASHQHVNGDDGSAVSRSVSRSGVAKDHTNRLSLFRSQPQPAEFRPASGGATGTDMSVAASGMEWVTDSGNTQRESSELDKEKPALSDHMHGHSNGLLHVGSVRKRLSMLKLGRKTSRGDGLMTSLNEE